MQASLRTRGLALAFTLALGATAASAADPAVPAGTLSPAEVARQLELAGYTNVHDVEYDDGRYEAEATSLAGTAVDLDIDPASGKIVDEETD